MVERAEDKVGYLACSSCGRVHAPKHRPEGAPIRWEDNRDSTGVQTFLLPGETEIDGPTMRKRILEYYSQIPGYADQHQPPLQRPAPKSQTSLLDPAPHKT